jgi:hypothetical protein
MNKQTNNSKSDQKTEKQDRLSQALRDNLKRRKAQAKKLSNKDTKDI